MLTVLQYNYKGGIIVENKMMLSIIIPVYNTELYLRECLDSILNQTIKGYEIIIINDGSVDGSKKIIMEYCKAFNNILYFEQENSGQGTARNIGIEKSSGKYLYFMDSDDYLVSGKLKEMLEFVNHENLDAVFFDGDSFLHERPEEKLQGFDYVRTKEYGRYESGEQLLASLSQRNEVIISPCLYIVKSDVIKENNLLFPDRIKHEDEYFTLSVFLYIKSCYHSKEIVFMRRLRQNSTMTNTNKIPSLNGYTKVLEFFDNTYTNHIFKSEDGEKAYFKKINQLVKAAFRTYSQVEDKTQAKDNYLQLKKMAEKYNYFNLSTRVYILLAKNNISLQLYTKIVNLIKK